MDLEEISVQDHLLNVPDLSPTNKEIFYKLLLNTLQSGDFRSFKNAVDRIQDPTVLDINYVYPDTKKTCLDIASRNGLTEFVKLLLRKGAEPNRKNEIDICAPIHYATEGKYVDTLAALLEEPTIEPNLQAINQKTALHIAVENNDLICASLLLEKGANASIPNRKGLTALHEAAMKDQRDMVRLILEKSQCLIDIDTYKDDNNQTAREVLQQRLPDILLDKYEKREVNVYDLKYYLNTHDETNFLKNLELVKTEILHDVNVEELLKMAVEHNFLKAVIEILEKFKGRQFSVKRAVEIAVLDNRSDILRKLLYVNPEIANDLILDVCQQLGIPKRTDDNTSDRLECLKLILEQKNVDVCCADIKGNTPLHYTARAGCAEAIRLLFKQGSYIGYMNKFDVPPIADIPARTLSSCFDDCLQIRKGWNNKYVIEFNYHCLMPHNVLKKHDEAHQLTREMEVFQYMADNNNLKHLLKHPILSSFLYLKWYNIRYILYAYFAFYTIFYILLNTYIYNVNSNDSSNENRTQTVNDSFNVTLEKPLQIVSYQNNFLRIFIVLLLLVLAFWEILQCISRPRHYMTNVNNLFHITLIVLTVVLICGANEIGPILILLSAWKLIILISQHTDMSTSFEMFRTVSITYLKLFFPYVFFIFAFALAFYTLFKDNDERTANANFSNPLRSLFKTIIMLTGEFDAANIPFVTHPTWSYIVFVLFLFFIIIVLLNLLHGLAVSDTAKILSTAELIGLISSICLITSIEDMAIKLFKYNICCRNSRWNPFDFLAKKTILFSHHLRDGKISVKSCDDVNNDKFDELVERNLISNESIDMDHNKYCKMKSNITKEAKQIILDRIGIFNRDQLSDNEKIMMELTKLREQLKTIEITLSTILKQS